MCVTAYSPNTPDRASTRACELCPGISHMGMIDSRKFLIVTTVFVISSPMEYRPRLCIFTTQVTNCVLRPPTHKHNRGSHDVSHQHNKSKRSKPEWLSQRLLFLQLGIYFNIDSADNIIMVTSNMAMISARPAFWPRRMSCDDSLRAALLVNMASECSELAVTL